jgi:hypothetical protein
VKEPEKNRRLQLGIWVTNKKRLINIYQVLRPIYSLGIELNIVFFMITGRFFWGDQTSYQYQIFGVMGRLSNNLLKIIDYTLVIRFVLN